MMNEQENIALVKKLYEAFARGDIKTILDQLTDDVKWNNPGPSIIPYSGDRTGPVQVREFFDRLVGTQENVNPHHRSVHRSGRYGGHAGTLQRQRESNRKAVRFARRPFLHYSGG
jgi:ketosteroid isomerase-like protein